MKKNSTFDRALTSFQLRRGTNQMKSKLFKLLPLVLFSLSASGYCDAAPGEQPSGFDQGHPVQASQMTGGYNSPARIDVEGAWDFYFTGSFIYWQPRMDGLSLGTYNFSPVVEPGVILNLDFDYKPGFKVGLGMNSSFDNWNIYAEYTWIRSRDHSSHSIPLTVASTYAFWNSSAPTYSNAAGNWHHQNNILDFILGRAHYTGTRLTCLPYVGVRAYWIDQDYNVSYAVAAAPTTYWFSHAEADSWAIGARAGVDTSWLLGKDFRLIGNLAGSLAYQKIKAHYLAYNASNVLVANYKDNFGQITPNIQGALGLGWGSYFSSREWHFDLAALYEFHYFWNQNAMRTLVQESTTSRPAGSGDLMYQGLTVTARLDF
jgi:hypothetical protein